MHFHVVTLFPKAFDSYIGESILKRAIEDKKIKVTFYNPRDFADNKWDRVDRKPYSGGPGMVLEALPVIKAIEKAKGRKKKVKIIFLLPSGKQFDNEYASKTAADYKDVIIVCGRYEGIDSRVQDVFKTDEVSIGPYVLTGGELPALIIMDTISRQVKGVLGNFDSIEENRISSSKVYTRPEVFKYKGKEYKVPEVLLSGHQAKIEEWKKQRK